MTEEEETPARLEKTFHALDAFTSVLRTDKSARQYVRRLSYFFDHLHLPGTIEEQAEIFFQKAQDNKQWAHACLMDFIDHYKKKISKNEISPTTLSNYYVAVKVFCEMNNIELHWKRIRRGLPRPMLAADDRAPSLEEIKKLCDYPDRRIKPIVYTMCSSGIRSGAWDDLKWKHITPSIQTKMANK